MPEALPTWRDQVTMAAMDRQNGALVIADKAAIAFASARDAKEQELFDMLLHLVRGQRAMAPVLNLATHLEQGLQQGGAKGFRDAAADYHEGVESSLLLFTTELIVTPPTPANHWGFYSASSTVQAGLKALEEAGLACESASFGYSEPGGEGQSAFEQAGMRKEILYDTVLFEIVSKGWLDLLILGCDALDGRSFINKIGSGPLTKLAYEAGTGVELWATTHKMVSPEAMPLFNVYDDAYDDIFEYTGWLSFGTGDMAHVTSVRCEHGLWSAEQVFDYCSSLPIPSDTLKAAILEMEPPADPTP